MTIALAVPVEQHATTPAPSRQSAPDSHICHIVCWSRPESPMCGTEELDADDGWCPDDCPHTCVVCVDIAEGIDTDFGACVICERQCWLGDPPH